MALKRVRDRQNHTGGKTLIKIAMNGAAGRMGRRIVTLVDEDPECELVCALESDDHPLLGQDAGKIAGTGEMGIALQTEIDRNPDVLIDFSAPDASMARAEKCAESGIAMVIGTTGFTAEQENTLKTIMAEKTPILLAPNMGLGVNLLFQLTRQVAEALGEEYDVEIIEAHHRRKKDAPSGTAGELAENVCEARGWDSEETITHGREGITGERPQKQLGMHAVRGGSVVGDHTVIFAGDGERIELTHRAQSRDLFARGAIHAAAFLDTKNSGVFTMQDVLF